MSSWKIEKVAPIPKLNNPILLEGLPGIGNVGKVAIDFIIDEIKAKKLYQVFSYTMPHSVFVNEDNLVELPSISIYHKKVGNKDILLLAGDVQPIDEISSYEFSEAILDLLASFKGKELITLGGIGLPNVPKKPKIFCTGNSKKTIKKYMAGTELENKLYGIVGPIIGVSGLLLGLAKRRNIEGVSFLAETYGHPMYLGLKGARELVNVLSNKLKLNIDLKELDKEVDEIEAEVTKKKRIADLPKSSKLRKLTSKIGKDVSYIG
ncbi:MAG: hypothetical protein GY861_10215 [bacterium]|nr:hypothetical protein [bacterium]